MRARKDYQPDPESSCDYEQALLASNVLAQLRPIIGDDQFKQVVEGSYEYWDRVLDTGIEEAIQKCLHHIRKVRGRFKNRHDDRSHLNLNVSLMERTQKRFNKHAGTLSSKFNFCRVFINWGRPTRIRTSSDYRKQIMIDAPYNYGKQIEAELAWTDNKVVGPYSYVEESPDGIKTARCQYAKMDKHHDWYAHDGYLAWMPHDECIKVKAIGDDREKAERAARSAARREVLAALG